MPRLLTQRHRQIGNYCPAINRNPVQFLIGMAAGFTSESAPSSPAFKAS